MAKTKKFTETPIPLIGKELYFKRCPMSTLKVYDEKIQEQVEEIRPLITQAQELQDDKEALIKRIANLEKKAELIDKKESPSDEELQVAIDVYDKIEELHSELKEISKQILEFDEENKEVLINNNEEASKLLADKVEAMLNDITAEEFLENYDAVDLKIAQNLSSYYEMCILGEKESKIRLTIQEDISEQKRLERSFRR